MSRYLQRVLEQVRKQPEEVAFFNSSGETLSYGELDLQSTALARYLQANHKPHAPVIVYGHKSPYMLVSFIACMKAGFPYVPIDIVYPRGRVLDIIEQLETPLFIDTSGEPEDGFAHAADQSLGAAQLEGIVQKRGADPLSIEDSVSGEDIVYIIFTSGSTGKPKGVQMNASSHDAYMDYIISVYQSGEHGHDIYFNRAPFSFDFSVFDLSAALPTGGTLFSLDTEAEQSMARTFEALREANPTVWISTPSFLSACLAAPDFSVEMFPELRLISTCGEMLRNKVAASVLDRFEGVRFNNSYGPTEASPCCCDIDVSYDLIERYDPMPVGTMNPTMRVIIRNSETLEELPAGEVGELFLAGATVSRGYYGRPDLTERAFSMIEDESGNPVHCYRTGDKGYVDDEGQLFCLGRLDFQVKLNGFRIELGEIERALCRLPEVYEACVLAVERNEVVSHLCAFVQLASADADTSYSQTRNLKQQLKETLPDYMIPRSFRYLDEFPMNQNDKIDRKQLAKLLAEK